MYEVRDEGIEAKLKDIGHTLRNAMPEGWGFTLLMFTYGEKGSLFYTSSAMREDMIATMKEFIAKQEGQLD